MVVILHPIFPIVVVPEGVVVVMGPTVSYITGRKENMFSIKEQNIAIGFKKQCIDTELIFISTQI